jgi:hypothetical protein
MHEQNADRSLPRKTPDDLFAYIRARHQLWINRAHELPHEKWTDDPILQTTRLENIYRELDRGTRVVIVDILGQDAALETIVWNVIRYRVFNFPHIFELTAGFMQPEAWNVAGATAIVLAQKRRHNMVAYRVPASGADAKQFPDGDGQTTRLWCWRLGPGYLQEPGFLTDLVRRLRAARTPVAAHAVVMTLRGMGDFTAYQIYLDLCYGQRVLPFSEDEWTTFGEGAESGLRWLGMRPTVDSIRELWAAQPRDLPGPRLSLCNVQYALCGAQKYWRGWSRSGKVDTVPLVAGPLDPRLWPPELIARYSSPRPRRTAVILPSQQERVAVDCPPEPPAPRRQAVIFD